jgi:predicted RNA-binding Zn-ribbon protein involved in translation (DUF1610 family)
MMSKKLKQILSYMVDLTKTDREGAFQCPLCGNSISPDEDSEKDYSILEAKVNASSLEEVVIRCNRCESQINLIGFPPNDWLSNHR